MTLFWITLQALLMLITISFVGMFLLQRKVIAEKIIESLSPLVLEVALPALIFSKLITNFNPHENWETLLFPLWGILFVLVRFLITWPVSSLSRQENRAEMRVSLLFQNATFIPLIIISALFGNNSTQLNELFLFTMLYPAIFFNSYFMFFDRKKVTRDWKVFLHPITVATIFAVVLKSFHLSSFIPSFLLQAFQMIGQMTIPLLMITLGGIIYVDFKQKGKLDLKEVALFVFINNIVFPSLSLVILSFFSWGSELSTIILIQSAVPPLTALPVVMSRVGGNRSLVNQFVVASFVFSALSIPLFIYLAQKFSFI